MELGPGSGFQGTSRRTAALFVDLAGAYFLLTILNAIFGGIGAIGLIVFGTVAFNYLVLAEWRWGQTLGKRMLRIRVYAEDGTKPSYNAAALRNVGLVVDFLPIFFLLGLILISESSKRQRIGDRWGKTVVLGPAKGGLSTPSGYQLQPYLEQHQ